MTETTITTANAYMIGHAGPAGQQFEIGDDNLIEFPYSGLLIAETCLNDMNDQGKGYGKELYRKALEEYNVLYSVWPISMEAINVHESLIRSGIARKEFFAELGISALIKTE